MKKINIYQYCRIAFVIAAILTVSSCEEKFLEPEPLSFYTAENALVDANGFNAVIASCLREIRAEFYGDGAPMITENLFSEVAVEGTTDKSGPAQDLNLLIVPDANLNSSNYNRIGWFWEHWYEVIKHANIVISRLGDVELSQADHDEILGSAYFCRAYVYYRLTHQFGDVPLILEEIKAPKLDFYSTERKVILQKIKQDLDQAKGWVPASPHQGKVSSGAVNHLLAKVNLALGDFDGAINAANAVINGGVHALMTERFGSDAGDATKNVVWDLHRPENKAISENKEGIFLGISRIDMEGDAGTTSLMRQAVPLWWARNNTPSGLRGTHDSPSIDIPLILEYGRGIGRCRATPYSTKFIWEDIVDYRHAPGNWVDMEDLVYNYQPLKDAGDPYYGKNLQLYGNSGEILCVDTIRAWYSWPQYKLFIPDPEATKPSGGDSDWYIFRTAETHLLRAEAYYWKGDMTNAVADVNAVRARANARLLDVSEMSIATILDERARELYYEEPRKTELTRIAFIMAETGKPSETGKTYSMSNFSDDNYMFDRSLLGGFYNRSVRTVHGDEYTMSPYHVLWPVPAGAINANTQGQINQNKGYSGYENNVPALTSIPVSEE